MVGLAQAQGVAGDKLAKTRIVQDLAESGHRYVSPYNVARAYAAIDDKQRALEWLEKAYLEHNPDLIELTREPSFASLRCDAKFRELSGPTPVSRFAEIRVPRWVRCWYATCEGADMARGCIWLKAVASSR